jgi:Mrp family chromosome partitioning ATPase
VTTLAHCLASHWARHLHLEVLLVEANYHRPALAKRMALDRGPGFAQLLAGTAKRDDVVRSTMLPRLSVVTAGTTATVPDGQWVTGRPADLLRSLASGFQVVLLDLPSLSDHPEFRPLVWGADRVVPVFAANHATKAEARRLLHGLETTGGKVTGVILNRWRSVRPFWLPESLAPGC